MSKQQNYNCEEVRNYFRHMTNLFKLLFFGYHMSSHYFSYDNERLFYSARIENNKLNFVQSDSLH